MSQSLSETAYGLCPVFLGGSAKMLLLLTCTRQPGRGIGGVWNGELSEFHELFEDRTWWTGSKEVSKNSLNSMEVLGFWLNRFGLDLASLFMRRSKPTLSLTAICVGCHFSNTISCNRCVEAA